MNKKILKIILIIIVILYIGKVSMNTILGKDKTVLLKYGTLTETINTIGYIITDETTMDSPISGKLYKEVKSGTRVTKGYKIANVMSQAFDKEKYQKLNDIINRIHQIKNDKTINPYEQDIEKLDNLIDNVEKKYNVAQKNNQNDLESIKRELINLKNKREQILRNGPDSLQNLDELNNEKMLLENEINQNLREIQAPDAGIVSFYFDNYEDIINTNNMYDLNLNLINGIVNKYKEADVFINKGNKIAKIINNYNWYIAIPLNGSEANDLKEGNRVIVKINGHNDTLRGNILKSYKADNGKTIIILKMIDEYKDFYKTRKIQLSLKIATYSGFIIPYKAIVKKDDVTGLFVLDNNNPIFKRINLIYHNNSNAIIESADKDNELKLYDEALVNSKYYIKK